MRIRVGVVGATGYSGIELIRIVLRHPAMELVSAMAIDSNGGKSLGDIHPRLAGLSDVTCVPPDPERLASLQVDTAFLCTPNEVSHELAPRLLSLGIRIIDLSGAFRLRDADSYPSWYGFRHEAPEWLRRAVYGLSEWNVGAMTSARLVANPGCYATSLLLPLLPLVRAELLEPGSDIVCDAKSGVTGAGRGARMDLLFGEAAENFRAYSPITHRHVPEMCQEMGWDLARFVFVPHLLPVRRGILTTIYVSFLRVLRSEEIYLEYRRRYDNHPFVRILGDKRLPELRGVRYTNFCDIGWRLRQDGRHAVIFSAIDNLVKGAAGPAVQNFNLMNGLDESLGLLEGEAVAAHS